MKTRSAICSQQGFTLIELSIVLVIIGLIVGGVLLGRDLIAAAEIRAQISQLEKFQTSLNTFRIKYGYLPGDLPFSRAAQLGFFAETTLGGTPGHQDGNGIISGTGFSGEYPGVWRHLSDAQMIDGSYGTTASGNPLDVATGEITVAVTPGTAKTVAPPDKIGRGSIVIVTITPNNYFTLLRLAAVTLPNLPTMDNSLLPLEAHEIDRKLDDGFPNTGKVIGYSVQGASCTTGSGYSVSVQTVACGMYVKLN